MNKSMIIRVLILIVILSAASFFVYKDYLSIKNPGDKPNSLDGSEAVSTTTTPVQNGVKVVPPKSDSKPVADKSSILKIMPNLDKKWVIPESINEETRTIIERRIADLNKALKADYEQYDKWIDLGILRKIIEDYDEARNIWEFAATIWPDGLVAFHNLGDLYHFYLKDYTKAEVNMLKVIKIDPHYVSEYGLIYDLYKRQYGIGDQRTLGILLQGLKNNQNHVDLMVLTAGHYRDVKDTVNARKYYEMALARAKELNNLNLQKAIEDELKNI